LLVCAPLLCQPVGRQAQLVIRTNVHVVEVSIVATDARGAPAGDLGAADFRVWDNGKEQTVTSLERLSARAAVGRAELPPNTYSNRIGNTGRPQVLSMILLDAVNTKYRNQTVARRAVANILDQIQPEDRVAIYAFGSYLRTIHDFSSNRHISGTGYETPETRRTSGFRVLQPVTKFVTRH
jgi:VWFA-related protein